MKSSGIGGQAVLEGVMMKNKSKYAVAVRTPNNQIEVKTDEFHSMGERVPLFRVPVFRGMAAFAESLVLGIRSLNYSSDFAMEGEKDDKEASKTQETLMDIGVVVFSVMLAVAIFILFPLFISNLLGKVIDSETVLLILEGVLRIVVFVAYVLLISRMNDIKRVFMYHGAEHKCINCVENGEELTVANVRRQSRCHKRCGTSFMLIVMLVSFLLFMFIRVETVWLRYVLRIVLIPFIAGISYEFIRLAGNSDNKVVAVLSKPGFWMQGLTTKEPDDSMIEVAIASVEAVFDWNAYQEKEGIAKRQNNKKNKKNSSGHGRKEQKEQKEQSAKSVITTELKNDFSAPSDEEEDDILRALDKFFVYEGNKTVMEMGEPTSKKSEENPESAASPESSDTQTVASKENAEG